MVLGLDFLEAPFTWLNTHKIEIPPVGPVVVSVLQMVAFITPVILEYRSNKCLFINEECTSSLMSAIFNFTEPTWTSHLNQTEMKDDEFVRYELEEFVQYLADPYQSNPFSVSFFSRRMHSFQLTNSFLLAISYASILFRDSGDPYTNGLVQGLGGVYIVCWWWYFWAIMWRIGWLLKAGAIARQIRRECFKQEDCKGLEDIKKHGMCLDPEERLKLWIRESWKARLSEFKFEPASHILD